jgi:hypothetical protein
MSRFILFAASSDVPGWLELLMRPEVLVFCIPLTAIVGGIAYKIPTAIIAHRERMAKIQQGIDPDARPG